MHRFIQRRFMDMDNKISNFKYNISEALELPKDLVLNLPKIVMIGNIQMNISNHKGIIEYTQEVLRVNSSIGIIKISGSNLELKTILSEEIIIKGSIEKVEIIG
jgi:sporulation protein YqfC